MHSATFWNILHASCMNSWTFCNILHAFWNLLEHSAFNLEIFMPSGTLKNILHSFWNILESSACILEHSRTISNLLEHSACICMHSVFILEHSSCILEHSGAFKTFYIHSVTFLNILHTFWNILEHSRTFCKLCFQIVKPWSKSESKPLSQQAHKSNKSPPKKEKRRIWTLGWH